MNVVSTEITKNRCCREFFYVNGRDHYINLVQDRKDVAHCPACGIMLNAFDHGFPWKAVLKDRDLVSTMDGFEVASPRLKAFLEENCTSPIDYFETGGGRFVLRPKWSIYEDFTPNKDIKYFGQHVPTVIGNFCKTCGRHNSLTAVCKGILPGQKEIGPYDLFRSATERGWNKKRNFSIIAGQGLVAAMKAERFKGAVYNPVLEGISYV